MHGKSPPERANSGRPAEINTLMYLTYGEGWHVQETIFSLLTAFNFIPVGVSDYRYVVYTDTPSAFESLGVEVRTLTEGELGEWLGGTDYIHRRKTMAIIDALKNYGGNVAFIDSDTYFRKSPAHLFHRVSPSQSCMHVMESPLNKGEWYAQRLAESLEKEPILDERGKPLELRPDDNMWNTGVLALNALNLDILEQAPAIMDQLWLTSRANTVEQYVAGLLLSRKGIRECIDIVFHYWMPYIKEPFHARLPALLDELSKLPISRRPREAFLRRPKPTPAMRAKGLARSVTRKLGFKFGGIQRSA